MIQHLDRPRELSAAITIIVMTFNVTQLHALARVEVGLGSLVATRTLPRLERGEITLRLARKPRREAGSCLD